jgi:hypothetical protein
MRRAGFEPKIPASERAKTVHALDRAGTTITFLPLPFIFPYAATAEAF